MFRDLLTFKNLFVCHKFPQRWWWIVWAWWHSKESKLKLLKQTKIIMQIIGKIIVNAPYDMIANNRKIIMDGPYGIRSGSMAKVGR